MNFYKVKLLCVSLICSLAMNTNVVAIRAQESSISIDGNFQDWTSASQQLHTISNSEFSAYAAFQDSEATYIHIVGKSSWSVLAGGNLKYIDEAQTEHTINFTGLKGDPFVLSIKNTNQRVIEGASISGSLQNNNREWEIRIPKAVTGNILKLNFHNTEIVDIPALQGEVTPPVEPEEPDTPSTENGIKIDGYFDDWTNLRHYDLSWNNDVVAKACAVLDNEDSLCVHVGAAYRADRHLNIDNIRISVNDGEATQIKLRQYNTDGSISTEPLGTINENERYKLAAIIQKDGTTYNLGNAYYSTKMANNREDFEFCMELGKLEEALGLPKGSMNSSSKIELTFPSIGDGKIIIEGTTTGPFIGIGLCIAIVAIGFGLNKRKNRTLK